MAEYLKIPKDRVGVLVGKEGKTKAMLQKRCKVKLDISHDGGVSIVSPVEDGLIEWGALDVVKAIGRGFNPRFAINLLKEGYSLSVINLYDIFHHSESDIKRMKSRIIGEHGKAWKTIELLTDTKMSVYGRTVALIGREEDLDIAEKAIQMLIRGSQHQNVYKFLETQRSGRRIGL